MEKKEKKTYEAPALTVVTFKMEQGYASSSGTGPFSELFFWENNEQDQMEDYQTGNGWNQGSNHFWD